MRYIVCLLFCALFAGQAAAANPGKDAQQCVSVESKRGEISLTNNCSEQIFILWCGDMKYSKERCGDGPNGSYYAFSNNLGPGRSSELRIRAGGNYSWAACYGGISFGKEGYEDYPDGSYKCLPTGHYAR
ncbi:hypothetical protein GJ699_26505 [Duganella sp. FT80W]|uniref:Uncharacterized protein n=1 Tax=Duganella guangzhouensis TaxID=2666084 RepID=A0A6I2L5W9_9BURK|nr:hypothetical protein [Duganella guangzhouensis]MRW93548.1 hypothetical protein [Duganella guangzhouensis]